MNKIKKTIFLLNINNYSSEITSITYPLIEFYSNKIGADIYIIDKRKFPEYPVVYEKLQIYELSKKMNNDWNIYIDSDTLIHPETIDFTNYIHKDTVLHHGADFANVRWKYDEFFLRDGRNIGSCNWFTIASDWCVDLWKPIDDITLKDILNNIQPAVNEVNTVIKKDHLIDDYTLSRNIAKYGLKFITVLDLLNKIGLKESFFFWHIYTYTIDEKLRQMKEIIQKWEIDKFSVNNK